MQTHPRTNAALAFLAAVSAASCQSRTPGLTLDQAVDSLSMETFLGHQSALSSDAMEGRRPGRPGYDSAAAYVAREAETLGLEPGGVDGTYFQPIVFRTSQVVPESREFSVGGAALDPGSDFTVVPRILSTETDLTAPLVFAGFGISAPFIGYDDLDGIDVAGKLVVIVEGAPESFGSLERTVLSSGSSRDAELLAQGAAGVVVVLLEDRAFRSRPPTGYVPTVDGAHASPELGASLFVASSVARDWFAAAGREFDEVVAALKAGETDSFDLEVEGRVRARYEHDEFESANVAALLPGSDGSLRDEHLVVTAHLDHLGVGIPIDGDSIYNGTLDNASGSSALLTLASALTRMDRPRRSVLFLWVTAEESGLLGSDYFARFPTVDGAVVANQNVDGVMGLITASTDMLAFGYEHSNLSEAVDFAVARTETPVSPDPTPDQNLFIRSDQYAFVRQGIPAIWVQSARDAVDPTRHAQAELDAWIAERYHRPSDDLDQPMDLDGIRTELRTVFLVLHHIANEMGPIRWDTESFLYQRFGER